jgi:hypothetical protein
VDTPELQRRLDNMLELMRDPNSTKLEREDALNSLLGDEFATNNGIPTTMLDMALALVGFALVCGPGLLFDKI